MTKMRKMSKNEKNEKWKKKKWQKKKRTADFQVNFWVFFSCGLSKSSPYGERGGGSPERPPSMKGWSRPGTLCDRCPDAQEMQSVARRLAWFLLAWDIGLTNFSRPVSPLLAHVSQTRTSSFFHLQSTMETIPFPFVGVANSSHNKPKQSTAGESSGSIIGTKASKSSTYTAASSVDSALPLAVVKTAGSFDLLLVFFNRSEFSLTHHVERCASDHNKFSIFMFAIWPRCDNFLWSRPAGRSEESHAWT